MPIKTPDRPYAQTSIQKAIKAAAVRAKITKRVTPHVLRHSYATGLLEAGVDILTISRLLGHASFVTTMVYLHVRQPHLQSTPGQLSLFDQLREMSNETTLTLGQVRFLFDSRHGLPGARETAQKILWDVE